ncbi:CARDB domain-containing protein [Paenibacillus sp. OAS669]|uniref:CARDB domain-containing protein n=1 Tax=Paenibacillus sp. OAS669 TaxID=2663821 RepID=UPI00178BF0DB|nr:CARDB domain-containing protein [Paenibacillus sp. OAS669]MBE1447124.1 hypothetical protein [Paenibacillus sp. OAS669]
MRKIVILILILWSIPILINLNQLKAADLTRHELGEVYIDPSVIALDNTPGKDKFISKYSTLNYPDYVVDLPNVVKVELEDLTDKTKTKTMPSKGGSKYELKLEGTPLEAKRDDVRIPKGYYEWFRDPNKVVWMYDFDGRHHLSTRPNSYLAPPSGYCKVATSPYDKDVTNQGAPCNVAKDYREGTLWTNTLVIPSLKVTIDIKDVDQLKFDNDFAFIKTGTLTRDNISDQIDTKLIDPNTLRYRFDYEATYDVPSDETIKDETHPDGMVLRWYNEWSMNITGKVYQYSKMKIVAYTDDTPPPDNPDLLVADLIAKNVCIAVGQPAIFEYTIKNAGPAFTKNFKVSIRVDGVEIKSDSYTGLGFNESKSATFNYTFTSEVPKTITVFVDSGKDIDEGTTGEDNNTASLNVEPKAAGACDVTPPKPPDLKITGDFTISRPTIYFTEDNNMFPENISVTGGNGCTYVSHQFNFTQGSARYYPYEQLSPKDKSYRFAYDSGMGQYGGGIMKGTVSVKMQIHTSCGVTDEVGPKTFEIITDPNNKPPVLEIAWYSGSTEIKDPVVLGATVSVKVKKEEDPDPNDIVTRTWYFNEGDSWIQSLPSTYKWREPLNAKSYNNIVANVRGSHKVCAISQDDKGNLSNKACAYLDVIGPEPVPVISGATKVKVNRPMNPPLDADKSYSPAGRAIDHVRDEWNGSAVWDDGTTSSWSGYISSNSFNKPGQVTVTLDVFDNIGLKSVEPDYHTITVTPDEPPIIEFQYLSSMIRQPVKFKNTSYSPDGDGIETYRVSYGYDWNNNGTCNVYETYASYDNNEFTFNPARVGNYCFRVYAKEPESYGLSAFKDYWVEVINDNPEVTFTVTGEASEPSPMNVAGYPASELASGSWTNTTLDKPSIFNSWATGPNGSLISSRRYPGDGPSLFSLPLGDENIKLRGKPINIQNTTLRIEEATSIGNNEFILGDHLVSPNHDPIKLNYTYGLSGRSIGYFNWLTDEFMLVDTYGPQYDNVNALYKYAETWTRWRLSDLRKQNTTPVASGNRLATWNSGPGYRVSGEFARWGDGYRKYGYQRTELREDFAEINLTSRTITYFKKDGNGTPYKTASFDNVAPFPQTVGTGTGGNLYYYPEAAPDTIFSPAAMDGKGNYYNFVADSNGKNHLIKVDGYTGMPTDLGIPNLNPNASNSFENISEDGTVITIYSSWDGYDDSNGNWVPSGTETYYNNITTGSRVGKPSAHLENFKDGYQNGYGFKTFREPYTYWDDDEGRYVTSYQNVEKLVDLSNDAPVSKSSIYRAPLNTNGKSAKITSDNQYLSQGYVYEYVPSTDQPTTSNEPFTFGQLIRPSSQQITNGTILWDMKTDIDHVNMAAGMGFRIQNYQNMYRLEATNTTLNLYKIVNGRKTLIKSTAHIYEKGTWTSFKIKLSGSDFKIYERNNLIIQASDSTFASGTMGPFSTADNSQFKSIMFQWSDADSSYATPGTAIVDTNVIYEDAYKDPENDPRLDARTQWHYEHVDPNMFLDIGDGKSGISSLNGQTLTIRNPVFDRVGKYKIDYRVPDDPHSDHRIANGDLLFQNYSQYSDWYTQYLIVHRRPISNFALGRDGNNVITWTDYSYDPDRCYNVGSCQSGYETNHGIYKKKFYYITPSGRRVDGKLVRPAESGTYMVYMAVADEYNAWSDWFEQMIDVCDSCIPAPNHPPTVVLAFPDGTFANPSPVSLQPTITWNQSDPDPATMYELFDLNIKDEWGSCVECVKNRFMGTYNGNWAWTMDTMLVMGRKYQAEVRVTDGEAWSSWSNIGWMATNSPPAAYMSFPYGTQAAPTIINTLRPTLTWSQSDPDPGAWLDYYQIQIINEENNVVIYDSGKVWQHTQSTNGSLAVPVDLPTGQKMRVMVRVWDQYDAVSPWSPQVWMMINRPPIADFDWTPKPAFEGDTVRLINRSSDPDGDPLTYEWEIIGPEYSAAAASLHAEIPSASTDNHPGNYRVTLTVTDIHGASDSITKIVPVGDLLLDGFVRHSPQWNENRQAYNLRKTGETERPRPYDLFWSGEAFVLAATTNEPASGVKVHMEYTEVEETLLAESNGKDWKGQMIRDDFEKLPDRAYLFRFTAVWPNGHTEYVERIIKIQNPWTDFATSVRKE